MFRRDNCSNLCKDLKAQRHTSYDVLNQTICNSLPFTDKNLCSNSSNAVGFLRLYEFRDLGIQQEWHIRSLLAGKTNISICITFLFFLCAEVKQFKFLGMAFFLRMSRLKIHSVFRSQFFISSTFCLRCIKLAIQNCSSELVRSVKQLLFHSLTSLELLLYFIHYPSTQWRPIIWAWPELTTVASLNVLPIQIFFEKTQRTFAFHCIEKIGNRLHPPRRPVTG
jgi:hypothetical protein